MANNIYRFRVSIQDLLLPDFLLHIFVQHDQPPKYLDLLDKIKLYSKAEITNVNDYCMIIEKDQTFKYKFNDDIGLQNAFRSITDQDILEIKLIREVYHDNVPLVKPIFTKRPSYSEENDQIYLPTRKDSGISLDQEMEELKKEEPNRSRKLPALSHIITTELWNTGSLPSPPTPQHASFYAKSPIKLPGLSSIIDPNHHNQYQQKQLAPIHAYHPVRFDQKPLSPPLSASPSSPFNTNNNRPSMTKSKRSRTNNSHPSRYICEHVIDTITGKTCCQAFRRSYDLSRHQTIHLKNRPLCYCHDCGKKFTRLDALRRHERIQGHNNK